MQCASLEIVVHVDGFGECSENGCVARQKGRTSCLLDGDGARI